jgi:hypothetical protein
LKPLFDRIPLYVLSRALFGETPRVRDTLSAQRNWGWRAMASMLTWRRIGLLRALTLPVDLLEGADATRLRERRRVLADTARGHAALLTVVCVLFIVALSLSAFALVFLFVPFEFLPESARALWALVQDDPPPWAQVGIHALVWGATSVIEPFYIGAGFGLYLNRRTQIEAWDVEIAFRRMRARLGAGATVLMLALAFIVAMPMPSHAQDGSAPPDLVETDAAARAGSDAQAGSDADDMQPLSDVFGTQQVDDAAFRKAVAQAYTDPLLRPKRSESYWERRKQDRQPPPAPFEIRWLARLIGFLAEFGLWLLLGVLVLVLAFTAKRWWPWLRGGVVRAEAPAAVAVNDAVLPDVLPQDIAAAARQLWREGRPRRALALLYRASVEAMTQRAAVVLVPGATESECLRAARRMPDAEDRDVFARIVRMWQYAAYAQRLPAEGEFASLLDRLSSRFGWAA